MQRKHLQNTGLALHGRHTHLGNFHRELSRSFGHTVLHVDRRHIGVSALLEINGDGNRTGIGGAGSHISHILHTVDSFFQRCDNALLQCFRTGTEIIGAYHDGRRGNIGILFYGQGKQPDDAQDDNRNRYDCRKYRAFNKCS